MKRSALPFLAAACLLPTVAPAATMTWGASTQISGDADVRTTGTLVGAFNLGADDSNNAGVYTSSAAPAPAAVAATTANGVPFAAFALPNNYSNTTRTLGDFTLHFDYGGASNTAYGANAAPFTTLSAAYQTLLGSGAFDDANDAITLTMNALTVGQAYVFQFWSNDSSNTSYFKGTVATAGNSVTMNSNTANAVGGLGQFVVGTFTADATSQVVSFNSNGLPLVNAFELRAVPEPSAWAAVFAGAGLLGLTLRRRRPRLVLAGFLAAAALAGSLSTARAYVSTSGGTSFDTGTPTPTLSFTTPITFTITTSGSVRGLVFDEWVTSDGSLTTAAANPNTQTISYQLNGTAGTLTLGGVYDNRTNNFGSITANDGFLYSPSPNTGIAVTAGQTLTILAGSFSFNPNGAFNPNVPVAFGGSAFLADTNGNALTALTSVGAIPNAVPEPGTWAAVVLGAGLLGLVTSRRRRNTRA